VNGQVQGRSDAHTMADTVGGPPAMWATIWLAWSFLMFFAALRYMRLKGSTLDPMPPMGADTSGSLAPVSGAAASRTSQPE
jgi:hypothetical protein